MALSDMAFHHKVANAIRGLSMDAVEKANSGHPGAPMGMADVGAVLAMRFLRVAPSRPQWPNRDRFVLSAGHASMLLYSVLHLMGFEVSPSDLRDFRQWGSKTPGHPEVGVTPGVETTTGPLGQGFANGVGMALAERMLAARFNTEDRVLVDHWTWVIASDGDLMEGVQSEAASLAGNLRLGKLVVWYDSNRITIDGTTDITFTEDVGKRFEAYGWHVQSVSGHDPDEIANAFENAKDETERPSIIVGLSHIAYGSPGKQDTSASHGSPLGEEEIRATKENLGWPVEEEFFVPDDVPEFFRKRALTLEKEADWWEGKLRDLEAEDPERYAEWVRYTEGVVPDDLTLPEFEDGASIATRRASGACIQAFADEVPFVVGGSADLAGSNKTDFPEGGEVSPENMTGRTIRFGIREHAMGSISNGMSLHGGLRPLAATFLVFSDYMRPAIRLSALMEQPVLYVFTHDSIYVGEDGPTHQPVEHLAALRSIPGLVTFRPADAVETAACWKVALRRKDGPTAFALTRQGIPVIGRSGADPDGGPARGGYILYGGTAVPDLVLVATGSEVHLAVAAAEALVADGVKARVVSMPSFELFEAEDREYRERVLPPDCTKRLGVEAGVRLGWDRYVGPEGDFIGMDGFGASAPGKRVAEEFGLTTENVLARARALL